MIHTTTGFMRNLRTAAIFMVVLFGLNACDSGDSAQSVAAITGQPTDQSVVASTTATFTVVATDATGYQWQSSTDGGSTFVDVSGATSARGRFAYVANADSDNVSVFSINPMSGALTGVGTVAAGDQPWFVTVDPSGKFAYVANIASNNVSIYTINATTGMLTGVGVVPAGTYPVSITTTGTIL